MARAWPHVRAALVLLSIILGLVDGWPQPKTPPVRFLGDPLQLRQRWKLFPVADRDRYRMRIEARGAGAGHGAGNGEWELLYRPHDDAHAFMADALEYRRLRGAWNPGSYGPRGSYAAFATWMARQVFAARPDVTEVRVRMERVHIEDRGRGATPTGQFAFELVHTRGEATP
jgi:hypothetical protein